MAESDEAITCCPTEGEDGAPIVVDGGRRRLVEAASTVAAALGESNCIGVAVADDVGARVTTGRDIQKELIAGFAF